MSIRLTVLSVVENVAAEQEKTLTPLANDTVLANSGLDSLCFAIIVARLEDTLGVDPFTASEEVYFPVTFGDFVALYENAAAA
ncbi:MULTISPECIES: phosphopantetheine-binding protein [Methylocystis]|uniref:Acyl carrier protein n=1 Tax=Methylocystis iwaonis TaxID=2885079 RepID=A0ABN6VHU6_9HYPH|nr:MULTISPECIES: phosphopantetheine-binding protein [Methylocystis]MBL1257062.1 acyl carrier protein [Methylocystis sp. Sn-Cys]BDV33797.1 acyl carrier protein [Methylocystis iwaonis]